MSAAQKIWILEHSKSPLKLIKEANEAQANEAWIFEGPCADFNEQNDNGRYYDKDDYLSHFSYLQPQIEDNALAGELDHADDYNPKMRDLSHVVRKLWYREDLNQVWIRIELFDEGEGKKAIAYAKKGMPIYISSRASGYIDDDGNVTLDTIYTFDIVYRPGFKVAELKKTNGAGNTNEGKLVMLHESSQRYSGSKSSIRLLEWKEPIDDNKINNKKKTNTDMEQHNIDNNKTATMGDLNKIYKTISSQLDVLKKSINGGGLGISSGLQFITENKGGNDEAAAMKAFMKKLEERFATSNDFTEAVKKLEAIMEWSELVRKAINDQDNVNKRHHRHINMVVNRINEAGTDGNYADTITQLKKDTAVLKKYADINTEFVNEMADKQDLIHEHSNMTTNLVNKMVDNVNENNDTIGTIKSNIAVINEHANLSTEFINGINQKLKGMSRFVHEDQKAMEEWFNIISEDEAKKLFDAGKEVYALDYSNDTEFLVEDWADVENKGWGFGTEKDGVSESRKNRHKKRVMEAIEASDVEAVLKKFGGKYNVVGSDIILTDPSIIGAVASALTSAGIKNTKDGNKLILESKTPKKAGKGKIDLKNIGNRVDSTIKSAKRKIAEEKASKIIDQYPYVSVLDNNEIVNFSKLNDVKKKMISDKVYESGVEERNDVLSVIHAINSDNGMVRMLSNMPNNVKRVWNKMDKIKKQNIISLYNIQSFNADIEVKAWWESLNIGGVNLQKVDENLASHEAIELELDNSIDSLGYGDDDIKSILL